MSTFTFTVHNYRCFGSSTPLTFKVGDGFSAFVGPNDAGKSTALRFFTELENVWTHVNRAEMLVARVRKDVSINSPRHVVDPMEVFNDRNEQPIRLLVALDDAGANTVSAVEIHILRTWHATVNVRCGDIHTANARVHISVAGPSIVLDGMAFDYSPYARLFESLGAPLYIPAFRNAINGGNATYFDLPFGTAFIEAWDAWKNGAQKLQRDAMVRVEEDIRRLLGYQSLAVNASPDKRELRVVVDGRSRNLSEMGSGVAEFLLIIGNLFLRRPKTILIDEPETHLHPSKQIELLRLLLANSGAGMCLFATHSLGLARSVTNNITLIHRNERFESVSAPFHASTSLQELLGEMNYTAQRESGARTVMFVEGVTDVLAMKHFLRLYGKDDRFVLLPLLGDCLINKKREPELQELSQLAIPCIALLDSERTAANQPVAANRVQFLEVWKRLGFQYHVLERRALENYFTDSAVKAVIPHATVLGHYEKPNKRDKDLNAAIALRMVRDDIEATDLGAFLDSL